MEKTATFNLRVNPGVKQRADPTKSISKIQPGLHVNFCLTNIEICLKKFRKAFYLFRRFLSSGREGESLSKEEAKQVIGKLYRK